MPDAVALRGVRQDDLAIFFEQQREPAARFMAAFTAADPTDRAAFASHWSMIMNDTSIVKRTVLWERRVAGHVMSFPHASDREVGYWIGREFWGRGIASAALSAFLEVVRARPLYARAAKDNLASLRVLDKCGFVICGEDSGFAHARGTEVEEFVLRLGVPRPVV